MTKTINEPAKYWHAEEFLEFIISRLDILSTGVLAKEISSIFKAFLRVCLSEYKEKVFKEVNKETDIEMETYLKGDVDL